MSTNPGEMNLSYSESTAAQGKQSSQQDHAIESVLSIQSELQPFLADALLEPGQAERIATHQAWRWNSSSLPHHTFIYMHKFTGTLVADGHSTPVMRKSAFLGKPGMALELVSDSDQEAELYIITYDLFRATEKTNERRIYERELEYPFTGWIQGPYYGIQRIASQLTVEYGLTLLKKQLLITELLHMLWPQEKPLLTEADDESKSWLQSTMKYMQGNYMYEIKLEQLAELANMHPSYYSQLFKTRMHKNPIEYITHLRMNRAKELLITSDLRIRDIARQVGYRDEFYFSRRFRNHSGYAPTAYSKQVHRNIVSLSYPYTDHLMTLGITPCAAQIQGHLPHLPKSLTLPFHAYEPWEQGREAFLDVNPDLILTKDNAYAKAMEHIGDIAPIITIPWNETDLFGHLDRIATLVDRTQAANDWLQRHERKVERARKKVRESIGQATVAVCTMTAKGPRMYSTRNFGHVFYRSLQLLPPERIQAELAGKSPGVGFNWLPITPGEWDGLEADILIVAVSSMKERSALLHQLANDPLWNQYPAVKNGRVHVIDWQSWVVYAPYSINIQLEEAVHLLTSQTPFR
ncbi:helix-turn-helix domain-containing protein [Paenibacillus xylanexedens]|uniref:helix-turn-helix domain-containing protein n=1 Tax=Paenibacillus xylanexedens TaxID=528191 RepID=UPI0011A51E1E|nr:helix-turn-helix domain-containing protein [Paenibacillus xylanexedens]